MNNNVYMECQTNVLQMTNNKTKILFFRASEELAQDIEKLALLLENGKKSKFMRKTFTRMVENAKKNGLI